jgi:ArsR family transcriptional regulator
MRDLANMFKALSDETRLEILALLLIGGELCVCDVEGALGITQSKASRHLRYLLNAGLVDNRRVGVWMHYVVPSTIDPARTEILRAARKVISKEKRAELQARLNDWFIRKAASGETCAVS